MRCFWCDKETEHLTDDHLIPYSLGGTKQFAVPACNSCQNILSKAEQEVARKSILALGAIVSPVRPRHPDRPNSGHLQPSFLTVKHPHGGYGETLFSAGEKASALPHIEIKVVIDEPVEGRLRGPSPEAAQRLIDTFKAALANKPGPDGFICEFTVNMDIAPEVARDPDFWPRIVLLPGDRLMIRVREPEELKRFVQVFTELVYRGLKVNPESWNHEAVIKGGTPHTMILRYDPRCLRRVAAKIAYGFFRSVAGGKLDTQSDEGMRNYILGLTKSPDESVSIIPEQGSYTTNEAPHTVVISPPHDRTAAIVTLYNFHFRVELGQALSQTFVAICEINGSAMRIANAEEAGPVVTGIEGLQFSQPWKKLPATDVRQQ